MSPDDEICLCFHVTRRKLEKFVRLERPQRVSQMSSCGGAGTGCGWCIPILETIFRNEAAAIPTTGVRNRRPVRPETLCHRVKSHVVGRWLIVWFAAITLAGCPRRLAAQRFVRVVRGWSERFAGDAFRATAHQQHNREQDDADDRDKRQQHDQRIGFGCALIIRGLPHRIGSLGKSGERGKQGGAGRHLAIVAGCSTQPSR